MNLKKLLQPFCANAEYGRRAMERPFSIGEWTYATDARIIIRVPRINGVKGYPGFPEKAPGLFLDRFKNYRGFVKPPNRLPQFKMEACDCIDNWGDREPCPSCHECEGTGLTKAITWVKIGKHSYQLKYLILMLGLPGLRINPIHRDGQSMRFLFMTNPGINGFTGEGLLMPKMNKPKTRL